MKTTKVTQPMKSMKVLTTLTGLFSPSFSSLNSGVTTPMPTRTSSGNASRKLASLTTLLMATLLLAACGGGGGGGGGGGASAPALATGLNSVKDGIVLTWNNPAGVRDITVIGSEYLNATSATPQRTFTHATYTNTSTDPEVVEPGSRTITITTGLNPNLYYSFNLTRNFDDNRTDTIVSARQYLTPSFVGVVTAALTTDKKGATLSWANPASVAGIASIRITRNEFANATASAPLRTVTTTTRDAAAIAASTTATLDITGLTANRYYTFTVTPIYAGNVEGPTSAATTPRLYLPPAIAGAVTATLDSGSAGVILSWSNPRSVLDITAISITRQEFANATGIVPLKTVTTMTTEPDALATAATLNISSGLTSDNYYTFTVSPIYSGDVVGPASSASNRVGPLQVSIDLDTLIAEPSADRAGFVTLTFSNPEGVSSVAVTSSRFTDSTTDTVAEAPFTSAFTLDAAIAPNARLDISGLTVNSYYEFAIFRNVQSGPAIAANPSERIYLLPEAISGVTA
ncbi:MAG: hypothetical protein K0U41_08645, partial [Gammaproteobacteria bacterium]|nr:hypothetical protein [Gammaproteobacteria bacterium]